VDLNTFRFDYDLTLVGLLMDGRDNTILARWGARDAESAVVRLSLPGLKQLLRTTRQTYTDRKPGALPTTSPVTLPDKYPLFAKTKRAGDACYHCHYVHDARIAEERANKTFRKASLFQYPYPENIGISLNPDKGNVVRSVAPGSAAEKAGVKAEDTIVQAGSTPVYSTADLQWALNPIPEPGTVQLRLRRAGKLLEPITLQLPQGWRKTDISWRPSQGTVPPILGIWEEPLNAERKAKSGIPADRMALRVSFLFPGEKWVASRGDLKLNDIIVAIGGKELPTMTPRQFHTHIRLNYEVGDTIPLTILRDGKRTELRIPAIDIGLEE
jgi:serine protease Do